MVVEWNLSLFYRNEIIELSGIAVDQTGVIQVTDQRRIRVITHRECSGFGRAFSFLGGAGVLPTGIRRASDGWKV
jgi:hypothetical protein